MTRKPLGQMLLDARLIGERDLDKALEVQQVTGERLGTTLLRLGLVSPAALAEVLADQQDAEGIDLAGVVPSPEALALVPQALAFELGALPVALAGEAVRVALADPNDEAVLRRLRETTGRPVLPVLAPQMALFRALKRWYGDGRSERDEAIRRHLAEIRRLVAEVEALVDRR